MAAKKSATKKATAKPRAAKPKSAKPGAASPSGGTPTPLKDTAAQRTQSIPILPDHVYRGKHHGQPGVGDLRVVSIGPGKDTQGQHYEDCVTVEDTNPPHRQFAHAMGSFVAWVVGDVTDGYESIPGARKGGSE